MIGEILRLVRVYHDMKAIELAEKLEISPSYLSEIENHKKAPSLKLLKKYADIFGTKPSTLLQFVEEIEEELKPEPNGLLPNPKHILKVESMIRNKVRGKIMKLIQSIEESKR
ncbi:MAG: helix-turn-helix transcriptional regulator [Opitutae bacterium]|jgi:transcriptional regulator with XRE-family HTH domain|nr:helix-turn-helix transcriptional regulator [Opitutae bacterium]